MSKLGSLLIIKPPPKFKSLEEVQSYIESMVNDLYDDINELYSLLNGRLSLVNMRYRLVEVTSNAIADTDFSVLHDLGERDDDVPEFFWYMINSDHIAYNGAIVRKGDTAWTSSTIYLKCNLPSVPLKILVIMS
jgi:hypothetical protein